MRQSPKNRNDSRAHEAGESSMKKEVVTHLSGDIKEAKTHMAEDKKLRTRVRGK